MCRYDQRTGRVAPSARPSNMCGSRLARRRWDHGGVENEPPDEQETVHFWTNPYTAEYKRRQEMLMAMKPYKVIATLRELNLTSYAFSKNALELQTHVARFPEIGNTQPFNPDVGDPFNAELSRLLANTLSSAKSLISGQRAILRDVWPKIGKQLSEFEQGEYSSKRKEVFETDEADLLMELRNYSQHQFLPRLDPTTYYSQGMPMAELQFRLAVDPLLKWDSLVPKVRKYLEAAGDSTDLLPIIGRYSKSVREFYEWFWRKVEEKMAPEREQYDAHVAELMAWGEEVFLAPDWFREGREPPSDWNGSRWMRRRKAEIRQKRWALGHKSFRGVTVDSQGVAEVGDHPWTPIYLRP